MKKPLHPMPVRCPITQELLEVTRLESPHSGVVLEGRFMPNEFAQLAGDELEFLRLFLKVRGNLKEAQRVMEVSYPTVRVRFERLLQTLGYEASPDEHAQQEYRYQKTQLLEALSRGDKSLSEVVQALETL